MPRRRGYVIEACPENLQAEAAAVLGLIIFPDLERRRQRFIEAAALIRSGKVSNTRYAGAWRVMHSANRILHLKRVPAGEIYRGVLLRGYGIRALSDALAESLNQLTPEERGRKNGIRWTREKVIQGVLTPSKSVAHLAMALSNFFALWPGNKHVMSLIVEPLWLERVIEEAELLRHEPNMLRWPSFSADNMIVVLTEKMIARDLGEAA
jgi:hypothetical protein